MPRTFGAGAVIGVIDATLEHQRARSGLTLFRQAPREAEAGSAAAEDEQVILHGGR